MSEDKTSLSPKKGIEEAENKPSAMCPGELKAAIPLSQGLKEYFGERKLTDSEHHILAMNAEYSLYSTGLHRLYSWATNLIDAAGNVSTAVDEGNYSKVDELLDNLSADAFWDKQQFRKMLLEIALVEYTD